MRRVANVNRRRGAALVELAVVLPILILFIAGIWEISQLIATRQVVLGAARDAGRRAATAEFDSASITEFFRGYLEREGYDTTDMADPTYLNLTDSSRNDPIDAKHLDHYRFTAVLPGSIWNLSPIEIFVNDSTNITVSVEWYSMKDIELEVDTSIPQV